MRAAQIVQTLEALGVRGQHLIAHVALRAFGEVDGGALAVCTALLEAVGDNGTVVMPAFTHTETVRSAPDQNGTAGTPAAMRHVAFHPDLPVSRELGAVAEAFRRLPGVLRSSHPTHSFAAWGRFARDVLSTQRDNNPFGPMKKLNVMQGQVLLLGSGLDAAVAIHLAEERFGSPYLTRRTAVRVNAAGYDERVVLENVPGCSRAFTHLEAQLDPAKVRSNALPNGTARKIPLRYLVLLATRAIEKDPLAFVCDRDECDSCAGKRSALGAVHAAAH